MKLAVCVIALLSASLWAADVKTEPIQTKAQAVAKLTAMRIEKGDYERAMVSAIQFGHRETIRLLILAGVSVNMRTDFGSTPLHIAAHFGETETVRFLLNSGANIYAKAERGATPLHVAAEAGKT